MNKNDCANCSHHRYKPECKPFYIYCNATKEYKNVNDKCHNFSMSRVDSQVIESFQEKLKTLSKEEPMTKEQFLKKYGQPNTVVSFKNDAEKMEFLKECEKHKINWQDGELATKWIPRHNVINLEGGKNMTSDDARYNMEMGHKFIPYIPYTTSPKSLIKDGWMGVQRCGRKVWFLPSIKFYYFESGAYRQISFYNDDLCFLDDEKATACIIELYDNLGNLQWKRESAKDVEIERIQAEMNKLAYDLSKLKGE